MSAKKRKQSLTLKPETREYFLHRAEKEPDQVRYSNDDGRSLWRAHAAELTTEFALKNPGRRPFAWWRWTATEMRERLGGVGEPAYKHFALAQSFPFGVASRFVYCDENDLPYFESEATYLKRLNLFVSGEEQDLPADAFEPEDIDPSRIWRWRPIEELHAEYAARKLAGTLGAFDERFDK